jgi:uncharacterized protein
VSATLIVSIHDVAPATLASSRRWADLLDERGIVSTLLAVPGPWRGRTLADDRETQDWLWIRECGGDEVGLHGWSHRVDRRGRSARDTIGRCVARGAEEFWSLDGRRAAARVRRGLEVLALADLHPVGFTPPGWLINGQARHAVLACGLGYVADHRGASSATRRLRAPALSHRPNGLGERAGALALSAIARRRAESGLPVRIALHPADLDRPHLVRSTVEAIDAVLATGAIATTYGRALGLVDTAA